MISSISHSGGKLSHRERRRISPKAAQQSGGRVDAIPVCLGLEQGDIQGPPGEPRRTPAPTPVFRDTC